MFRFRVFAVSFPLALLPVHTSSATEVPAAGKALVIYTPAEDRNVVLHNPDMGWVLYENYPLDPDPHGSSTMLTLPGESFPEVDAVAIMFSWQDIEPHEGVYDFTRVDAAHDYWRQRGKSIQLRMSTESLVYWAKRDPPAGAGVPAYVLARLRPDEKQTRKIDGEEYVVVDARNAFYRQRLSAFLGAVREHFDQKRPVTLIDLRGFGVWGEWHSGFRYPDPESRRAALKGILDTWCRAFPDHLLALSYSYDPDGPKAFYAGPNDRFDPAFATNYTDFLRFSAFDYALTKTNITFRRDGCGGAVHSNERRLNEEAFFTLHRAPMVGEFLGGYGSAKKGGSNWVSWLVEDALSLHPNYLNLLGWQGADARDFIRERPDLVAQGLRRMGYRLVPIRICYPRVVTNGVPFETQSEWVNRGVGRALRDYRLQFWIRGTAGATAASSPPGILRTSRWLRGTIHRETCAVMFSNLPSGDYQLELALQDPETHRSIELPLRCIATEDEGIKGRVRMSPIQLR